MQYTQYKEVNSIIRKILHGAENLFPDNFIGMYLHGSLVIGDFDETVSDIDLLVVVNNPLTDPEINSLQQFHEQLPIEHPNWEDRIEVAYLARGALRTFDKKRNTIGIISPGETFHTIQAGKDWIMSWFIVREHSKIISGPNPKELIRPISFQEYSDCVESYLMIFKGLLRENHRQGFQAYVILTMCRGLSTLLDREYLSKKKSAEWAIKRFPEWADLISDALIWRLDKASNKKMTKCHFLTP